MILAVGLGLIGLLLIYFEFFVPGGILGVMGGGLIFVSMILFAWKSTSLYWIVFDIFAFLFLLIVTMRIAFWRIKKKPAIYAVDDQMGYVAPQYDKKLIGMKGIALTDLKPSGHIEVEGDQYQAISESSYIKKGTSIKIIASEISRYKVRIYHD